jgi:hypothetical protein
MAEQSKIDLTSYTPTNAAARSLVLPGWGQWFNSQNTKAYILGSCAILGLAATIMLNSKASQTFSDYEKIGVTDDKLYSDYETQQGQAMTAGIFTAAVWIYGVIDAYVVADNFNKKKNNAGVFEKTGFNLTSARDSINLTYLKRF